MGPAHIFIRQLILTNHTAGKLNIHATGIAPALFTAYFSPKDTIKPAEEMVLFDSYQHCSRITCSFTHTKETSQIYNHHQVDDFFTEIPTSRHQHKKDKDALTHIRRSSERKQQHRKHPTSQVDIR